MHAPCPWTEKRSTPGKSGALRAIPRSPAQMPLQRVFSPTRSRASETDERHLSFARGGSNIDGTEVGSMSPKEARVRSRSATPAGAHRGFTLIELLVVVVIIGLLAGFVAPRYFSQ